MQDEPLSDDDRILLLGRQGAGKSLIGRLIAARLDAQFFSMGELLRAERRSGTELGRIIGRRIEAGEGVSPETSYPLMQSALDTWARGGALILDGVPRLADETSRVRSLLGGEPSRVIVLDVPTVIAVARLETRLTCDGCGWPHGPGWPPRGGRCTSCSAELKPRADDSPTGIGRRHAIWGVQGREIIRYYERLQLARTIRADLPVLEVAQRVLDALNPEPASPKK